MMPGPSFRPVTWRHTSLERLHPATRLAAVVMGVVGVFLSGPPVVAAMILLLSLLLSWTGLDPRAQIRSLRPWWMLAVFLIAVQIFFGDPLTGIGRPSQAGAVKGVLAVGRVVCAAAWLGLFSRVSSLDDLVSGMNAWLRPLRPLGPRVDDVPLVLAVALGTTPVMLGEGRRIQAVVTLRSTGTRAPGTGPGGGRWTRRLKSTVDRGRVVVPLLESLARRADALSLSLIQRRPSADNAGRPLPVAEGVGLLLGLVLLLWLAGVFGSGGWLG